MVYNHLKDKVKSFLQPFAESGQAVGAEDIKAYFEKLRGDEQGIQAAAVSSGNGGGEGGGDNRREQSGKRSAGTIIVGAFVDHRTSRVLNPENFWADGQSLSALGIGHMNAVIVVISWSFLCAVKWGEKKQDLSCIELFSLILAHVFPSCHRSPCINKMFSLPVFVPTHTKI